MSDNHRSIQPSIFQHDECPTCKSTDVVKLTCEPKSFTGHCNMCTTVFQRNFGAIASDTSTILLKRGNKRLK